MRYVVHVPPPPLSRFVEMFWIHEGTATHARERVLPTGTLELVVSLDDDALRVYAGDDGKGAAEDAALVCGAHARYFVIDMGVPLRTAGVHFRAGGTLPFFGVPADALSDAHVSLDALWGAGAGAELHERLVAAPDHGARFRLLEQVLLARLRDPAAGHLAVRYGVRELRAPGGPGSIRELTERIGISHRRFVQLFREQVGLTPKLFWRIHRFQEVLRASARADEVDWSEVALRCGFYDQAHFIHDFRDFSGLTPSAYLRLRTEYPNHLRLDPA